MSAILKWPGCSPLLRTASGFTRLRVGKFFAFHEAPDKRLAVEQFDPTPHDLLVVPGQCNVLLDAQHQVLMIAHYDGISAYLNGED